MKDPLSLNWIVGMAKDHPQNLHNLSTPEECVIFYSSGNSGVIWNLHTNQQRFLQGHVNFISCTAISREKLVLVTADAPLPSETQGTNMVILWDRYKLTPIQTIFNPHPSGCIALAFNPQGNLLATISQLETSDKGDDQVVALWDWKSGTCVQASSVKANPHDLQVLLVFNPQDHTEFASMSRKNVYFWTLPAEPEGSLTYYHPAINAQDFAQKVGDFTGTIFIPGCSQSATCTTDGDVVIWDYTLMDSSTLLDSRKAIKILPLTRDSNSPLCILMVHPPFLVAGSSDGCVFFYDYHFRVVAWFTELNAGSITSITFEQWESDSSTDEFRCASFIVATCAGSIIQLTDESFHSLDKQVQSGKLLAQGFDSNVEALACHPSDPLCAVLGSSGFCILWDFERKLVVNSRQFEKTVGTALKFSPNAKFLCIGLQNGHARVMDPATFVDVEHFRDMSKPVVDIEFSPDSTYLCVSHADFSVCIYRFSVDWEFLGNSQSHSAKISGVCFSPDNRLFTVGQDRRMVEYNLLKSTALHGVVLAQDFFVEKEHIPLTCLYFEDETYDNCVLVVTDGAKLKLWEVDQQSCVLTVGGPTFAGNVNQITRLDLDFLAFASENKVVGLIHLPLDGNPKRNWGFVAHAHEVHGLGTQAQRKRLLSAGDFSLNMWDLDLDSLKETVILSNPTSLDSFYTLISDLSILEHMKDMFTYAQIRAIGEATRDRRKLTGFVPFESLEPLMCALGFFPNQMEVENLKVEVGRLGNQVNFDQFVRLYLNHHPVSDTLSSLLGASNILAHKSPQELRMMLTMEGESLDSQTLDSILESLGESPIDRQLKELLVSPIRDFGNGVKIFPPNESSSLL